MVKTITNALVEKDLIMQENAENYIKQLEVQIKSMMLI